MVSFWFGRIRIGRKASATGDRHGGDGERNGASVRAVRARAVTRARRRGRGGGDARVPRAIPRGDRRDRPSSERIVVPCHREHSCRGDASGQARIRHRQSTYRVHLRVFLLPGVDIVLRDGRHSARGLALPSPRVARWRIAHPFARNVSCPSPNLLTDFRDFCGPIWDVLARVYRTPNGADPIQPFGKRCGFWILFQTPDKKVFWEEK